MIIIKKYVFIKNVEIKKIKYEIFNRFLDQHVDFCIIHFCEFLYPNKKWFIYSFL